MKRPAVWSLFADGFIVVDTPEGAPRLRTRIFADGDVLHVVSVAALADPDLQRQHLADVQARMAPLGSALERYAKSLGWAVGGLLAVSGAGTSGHGWWQDDLPQTTGGLVLLALGWAAGRWGPALVGRIGGWLVRRRLQKMVSEIN